MERRDHSAHITYLARDASVVVYGREVIKKFFEREANLIRLQEAEGAKKILFEKPEPKTKPQQLNLDV